MNLYCYIAERRTAMFKIQMNSAATRQKAATPNTREDVKAMIASGMCFR